MTVPSSEPVCRSCRSGGLVPIVDLGPQPDPDRLLDPGSADEAPRAPVQASLCPACGLVQLVGPRPSGRPPHGHGLASTPDEIGRDPWFAMLVGSIPDDRRSVLQAERPDVSLDAAFAGAGVAPLPDDASRRDRGTAGIVAAGHAFSHVEDPDALLASLERRLAPSGVLDLECHHVQGLSEGQFDVLNHAHRSYFSLHSLERLLERHGLVVRAAERIDRFGGSLRVAATRRSEPSIDDRRRGRGAGRDPGEGGSRTAGRAGGLCERARRCASGDCRRADLPRPGARGWATGGGVWGGLSRDDAAQHRGGGPRSAGLHGRPLTGQAGPSAAWLAHPDLRAGGDRRQATGRHPRPALAAGRRDRARSRRRPAPAAPGSSSPCPTSGW